MLETLKYQVHMTKEGIKSAINQHKFDMATNKLSEYPKVYFRLVRAGTAELGVDYIIFLNKNGQLTQIPSLSKKDYLEIANLMYTYKKGSIELKPQRVITGILRVPAAPEIINYGRAVANGCAIQLMQLNAYVNGYTN